MQCKNKGCNGHCRKGQFYCYDCYMTWLNGGEDAVQARLKELTVDKAELARLVEFANNVRHAVLGPPEFNGKPIFRDYSDTALFNAIHSGRNLIVMADKVARGFGVTLPNGSLVARRAATTEWLRKLGESDRVTATEIRQGDTIRGLNGTIHDLERQIAGMRGQVCPCRNTIACHQPQAVRLEAPDSKANQLNRIESLAKQGARAGRGSGMLILTGACLGFLASTLLFTFGG